MTKLSVLVVLGLFLTGCGMTAAQRQQEAFVRAGSAHQACNMQLAAGQIKTHVEAVQCAERVARPVIAASGYPYMDLLDLYLAQELVLAEKIDKGEITEAEANLQLAELRSRNASEEQRRSAAASQTQVMESEANRKAWRDAVNSFNQTQQQQQRTITCVNGGIGVVQCY